MLPKALITAAAIAYAALSLPAGAVLLCGTESQCIDGKCAKVARDAERQVIIITPDRNTDLIELGTYRYEFHGSAAFHVAKARADAATEVSIYRWQTTGGDAQLDLAPIKPPPKADASVGIPDDISFSYARPVTVRGAAKTAISTGTCFDPTNVLLGPSLVPGIVRADDNQRYFSDPANRKTLVAHCTFAPDGAVTKDSQFDVWLQADGNKIVCVREPGSDSLQCFDRVVAESGVAFVVPDGDGDRLDIKEDGQATLRDAWFDITDSSSHVDEFHGQCEKGPSFQ